MYGKNFRLHTRIPEIEGEDLKGEWSHSWIVPAIRDLTLVSGLLPLRVLPLEEGIPLVMRKPPVISDQSIFLFITAGNHLLSRSYQMVQKRYPFFISNSNAAIAAANCRPLMKRFVTKHFCKNKSIFLFIQNTDLSG